MEEIDYKALYVKRIESDIAELIAFLTSSDVSTEHLKEAFLNEIRKTGVAEKLKELL